MHRDVGIQSMCMVESTPCPASSKSCCACSAASPAVVPAWDARLSRMPSWRCRLASWRLVGRASSSRRTLAAASSAANALCSASATRLEASLHVLTDGSTQEKLGVIITHTHTHTHTHPHPPLRVRQPSSGEIQYTRAHVECLVRWSLPGLLSLMASDPTSEGSQPWCPGLQVACLACG